MGKLAEISYFKCDLTDISKDPFARLDFDNFYNMKKFNEQFEKNIKFKKLRDVITLIETGQSIERTDYSSYETEYVHIVPRDIKGSILDIRDPIYLNSDKGEELSPYRLDKDDILIAISSNVGDSVIFSPPMANTNYTISHYIVRLKIDKDEYDKDFLVYYLNHPKIKTYFRGIETGKTQQNLSKVYLRNLPIIDIPVTEQRSLVKNLKNKHEKIIGKQVEIQSIQNESTQLIWDTINSPIKSKIKDNIKNI